MTACAKRLSERNQKLSSGGEWGFRAANDNIVDPLNRLEQQINAHHEKIGHLMRARNGRPNDDNVRQDLDHEFALLRQKQREYADILRERYDTRTDLPSREDSDDFKKAMVLVKNYEENHSGSHEST